MAPLTASDAAHLIHDLYGRTGHQLEYVGMPVLGAIGGAAFVRWPDGRDGVLSRTGRPISEMAGIAEVLRHLRSRGVPAPRFDLITDLDDCTVIIQERLPGEPTPGHIDRPMMSVIVSMAESFADLLADHAEVPPFNLVFSEHRAETLAQYDDRSRRLLDWIESLSGQCPPMRTADVVHSDYHRDNILFDHHRALTGVVDWHEGNLWRGDWRYHLVHLAFDFAWALAREWNTIDPAAMQLLDDAIAAVDPELVDVFWAHDALQSVNMTLSRKWYPDADAMIDFALTRVPQ